VALISVWYMVHLELPLDVPKAKMSQLCLVDSIRGVFEAKSGLEWLIYIYIYIFSYGWQGLCSNLHHFRRDI